MKEWASRIGFQPHNVANQSQHLTSLLASIGATNGGDYARAVDALHAKVRKPPVPCTSRCTPGSSACSVYI
eukprot:scaffold4277_cov101-Isochrysis_galbana.AAC.1